MLKIVNHTFDSLAVTVDDDTDWVLIAVVPVAGYTGEMLVQGEVGAAGGLAGLQITRGVYKGSHDEGTAKAILSDADFATPNDECVSSFPAAPHTTAAEGSFQLRLNIRSAQEIGIWAKKDSDNTTLRVRGRLT